MNFLCKILVSVVVIINSLVGFANNNIDKNTSNTKDTVSALVITPSNPIYKNISEFSGKKIISVIDSLLELDDIPIELIREINEYAESRLLEHDFYNSLTNFYDNSAIPSQSTYENWDTRNISPYAEELCENDSTVMLTLTDNKNNCNFVSPIQNPVVTSNFGWRDGKNHHGIDLDLQVWDPVVASFDGMVRISRHHPGYGRVVVVRHYNGLETLYAHLHRLKVKPGDIVEAGDVVGLGGSSGRSTGSHLHYEVRFKGKPLNPRSLIDFNNNCLISDSLKLVKTKWSYTPIPLGVEYHTVKRGDNLYEIAKRYGTSISNLCLMNGINRNRILRVGQKIRVGS